MKDCKKIIHGNDLCSKHYTRNRRYGSPLTQRHRSPNTGTKEYTCNDCGVGFRDYLVHHEGRKIDLCFSCRQGKTWKKENNPNWKGGVTTYHDKVRKSKKYKEWRRDVFFRDHFTCAICGHRFIKIVAHHIKSFAEYKNLWFEIDNGITLCRSCHAKVHNKTATIAFD